MGWASRVRRQAVAGLKCVTCAYRPGTPASRDEGDPLLAQTRKALLEACQPFFCHDERMRFEGHRVMCAGHVDAMNALAARGFYACSEEERGRRWDALHAVVAQRDAVQHCVIDEAAQ